MKIGIGLIVRNEAINIVSCLEQFTWADYICIVDTGSNDDTDVIAHLWYAKHRRNLVLSYHHAKEQVSELIDGQWLIRDFSKARNIYLDYLDDKVDYVYAASVGAILDQPEKMKEVVKSGHEVYTFNVKRGGATFIHHRLWKTKLGIRYKGAVHECANINGKTMAPSGITVTHESGNTSTQEPSNKRNLRILEGEYKKRPGTRTLFYYAMALKDSKDYKGAVKIYREYLAMGGNAYHDERMFAWIYLVRCLRKFDPQAALQAGYKALGEDQRFSEIPMEMSYIYCEQRQYKKALAMAILAHQPPPKSDLFVEPSRYKQEPIKMIDFVQNIKAVRSTP